jgi:hypothetical protein
MAMRLNDDNKEPRYLLISNLKTSKYQSPINYIRVKHIVTNFDDEQLQPIDVSYRNGQYYVIDGQHRVEALKQLKVQKIVCQVHCNLTYEQEAKLYYELNSPVNRRTPTTIHRWNALLEAKNPRALEIKQTVERNGFIFGLDQSKAANKIIALATLDVIYKNIGIFGLDRVLRLNRDSWPGIFEAVDKRILTGLYHFVKIYNEDFTDKEFIKRLSRTEPKIILREGQGVPSFSASAYTPYAMIIFKYYNKGCHNQLANKF